MKILYLILIPALCGFTESIAMTLTFPTGNEVIEAALIGHHLKYADSVKLAKNDSATINSDASVSPVNEQINNLAAVIIKPTNSYKSANSSKRGVSRSIANNSTKQNFISQIFNITPVNKSRRKQEKLLKKRRAQNESRYQERIKKPF